MGANNALSPKREQWDNGWHGVSEHHQSWLPTDSLMILLIAATGRSLSSAMIAAACFVDVCWVAEGGERKLM